MARNATSNAELTSMVRLTASWESPRARCFSVIGLYLPVWWCGFSQPLKIEPKIAIFRWIIISRFKQGKPLNRVDVTRRGFEKGTKAVISVNFSAYGKPRFNNLRANFVREIPRKGFFNTHRRLHQLRGR